MCCNCTCELSNTVSFEDGFHPEIVKIKQQNFISACNSKHIDFFYPTGPQLATFHQKIKEEQNSRCRRSKHFEQIGTDCYDLWCLFGENRSCFRAIVFVSWFVVLPTHIFNHWFHFVRPLSFFIQFERSPINRLRIWIWHTSLKKDLIFSSHGCRCMQGQNTSFEN